MLNARIHAHSCSKPWLLAAVMTYWHQPMASHARNKPWVLAADIACWPQSMHAASQGCMLLAWPGSSPWLPAATDKIPVIFFAVEVNLACLWAKHS